MTRDQLIAILHQHPREAVVLATATQVLCTLPEPRADAACVCAWALDSARRWAMGATDIDEVRAAYGAAYAAYAAYDASAYDASAASASAYAAASADASDYADTDATSAAAAAYADAASDYAASADAARAELAARFPVPGQWGQWQQGRVIAMAGEYLWREAEGRFVGRAELTPEEAVDCDALEERGVLG